MALKEFDIIAEYFQRAAKHPSVFKGIGDDCAVVTIPENRHLVFSMDTLVSGRHFPENASPSQIATRAFCTCLSDLAAMGAKPHWFTLGLTLPEANQDWLAAFSQSLLAIAQDYECELVGGDTTQGPLTITLQVHGLVMPEATLYRDQAKVGDSVFVTGSLGDGAAALSLIQESLSLNEADKVYLANRFYQPEPQIKAGQRIASLANAAIDISDGLIADLHHIAHASQVDMAVDVECLPVSSACHVVSEQLQLPHWQFPMTGGDDYQLAFTVPAQNLIAIEQLISDGELAATKVGKVLTQRKAKPEIYCSLDGQPIVLTQLGYQHFAS